MLNFFLTYNLIFNIIKEILVLNLLVGCSERGSPARMPQHAGKKVAFATFCAHMRTDCPLMVNQQTRSKKE